MFGQHVRLFLFAGRRLHGHAGLARDNVEVQVEHHLAAGALIELLDSDARRLKMPSSPPLLSFARRRPHA